MNKFEERTGAEAIGRGLGPLAALTLVAIETVCLEWEAGRKQAGAGLLRAWHRSGKGSVGLCPQCVMCGRCSSVAQNFCCNNKL